MFIVVIDSLCGWMVGRLISMVLICLMRGVVFNVVSDVMGVFMFGILYLRYCLCLRLFVFIIIFKKYVNGKNWLRMLDDVL